VVTRISKSLGLLLALLLAAACGEPRPVLRIGTSGDYAPFSRDGAGFDVDVAERMAGDLGYAIEWVAFRWPELEQRVARNDFDVVMSGVTWRPERALVGHLSRAVAAGGPCLLGAAAPQRLAVNRGGFLESWARESFPGADLRTVDDNRSLPDLLARAEVDAIVTDSFELAAFRGPGQAAHCQPPRERKVYWVAPARAADLGPALDRWLAEHEAQLDRLRVRHFGAAAPRGEVDHVVDLLARRLALMPEVARAKRARGQPVEDAAREQRVLADAAASAAAAALDPAAVRELFALQIELARRRSARRTGPRASISSASCGPRCPRSARS